jgi:glycosyltransferase involved in cell wall biosynthesis
MRISFNTLPGNLSTSNGYGSAGFNIVRALQKLGHTVPYQDPEAPVELNFCQPNWYHFSSENQYHIGYTPWESTELPEDWPELMNECDEVWATSPWVADVYRNNGITRPISVFMHGVEDVWVPKRRRDQGVIKFLHLGEPSFRKGGQMAVDAFRAAFGDRTDFRLTIKGYLKNTTRAYEGESILGTPDQVYPNVDLITRPLDLTELVQLHYEHDVLVYPSAGEGFGLIPLQAMATGMPVICTEAWAPYREELLPELRLQASQVPTSWPRLHPGLVYKPDFDHLVELFKFAAYNFEDLSVRAFRQSYKIHTKYDWVTLTEAAFRNVIELHA